MNRLTQTSALFVKLIYTELHTWQAGPPIDIDRRSRNPYRSPLRSAQSPRQRHTSIPSSTVHEERNELDMAPNRQLWTRVRATDLLVKNVVLDLDFPGQHLGTNFRSCH